MAQSKRLATVFPATELQILNHQRIRSMLRNFGSDPVKLFGVKKPVALPLVRVLGPEVLIREDSWTNKRWMPQLRQI